MTGEDLIEIVEAALAQKDMRPATASRLAVGNPYLIRNMRRRDGAITVPSFENLQKLCTVLDLEFYIGPMRGQTGTVAPDASEAALRAANREAACNLARTIMRLEAINIVSITAELTALKHRLEYASKGTSHDS